MAGARTWILDQLDAERSRWMLWLPVAMGLGIAVYFELPSEPALWLGPALAAGALVVVFLARSGSFTGAVTLSGPAGVTFSPNPIPAAPSTTSTATISVPAGAPTGASTLTISGTAAGITRARSQDT